MTVGERRVFLSRGVLAHVPLNARQVVSSRGSFIASRPGPGGGIIISREKLIRGETNGLNVSASARSYILFFSFQ